MSIQFALLTFPQPGEIWKHVKTGRIYFIESYATLQIKIPSMDLVNCVVYYEDVDGEKKKWVRPLVDFCDVVDGNSRFIKIKAKEKEISKSMGSDLTARDEDDWQLADK